MLVLLLHKAGFLIRDFLRRLIDGELKKPGRDEIEARMRKLQPLKLPESTAGIVRHEHDSPRQFTTR